MARLPSYTVADPGFFVGGADPLGALTSDAGVFWQKCMQKQNNWVPLGAPPGSANDS